LSGKKTSRNNYAAQIEPTGHAETKRRNGADEDYLTPAQRRAYESQARFAKGGAAKMTPAWRDRPYPVAQRTPKGLKIHAPHSGEGLVMNIHLSDVHAISLHSGPDGYSGRVNVERMAARGLQSDAHPQMFHAPQAPQLGLQGVLGGGFGPMLGQMPYTGAPLPQIQTPRPMMPRPQGMSAWNAEGFKTLSRMP